SGKIEWKGGSVTAGDAVGREPRSGATLAAVYIEFDGNAGAHAAVGKSAATTTDCSKASRGILQAERGAVRATAALVNKLRGKIGYGLAHVIERSARFV